MNFKFRSGEPQDSWACILAWFDTIVSFAKCIRVSAATSADFVLHKVCYGSCSTKQSCVTEGNSPSFDFSKHHYLLCFCLNNRLGYCFGNCSNFSSDSAGMVCCSSDCTDSLDMMRVCCIGLDTISFSWLVGNCLNSQAQTQVPKAFDLQFFLFAFQLGLEFQV